MGGSIAIQENTVSASNIQPLLSKGSVLFIEEKCGVQAQQ